MKRILYLKTKISVTLGHSHFHQVGWVRDMRLVKSLFPGIEKKRLISSQTDDYPLLPSLNLRTNPHLASSWMQITNDVERFINLTLSLIHPGLFQTGLTMLQELRKLDTTKDIARQWQSVYTGISIVSNRITPPHRDSRGRPEWFDTLLNCCDGDSRPRLIIKDLGLDLEYSSGTVVGFCGSIFQHEVQTWGPGDRICYAHFMRESVRKRLDVAPAGWVDRQMYLPKN